MKATATAPANIAFIKYWGKTDSELRLPANSSFSMNLSEARTTTTVEFSSNYTKDVVQFIGEKSTPAEHDRIIAHIDRLRSIAGNREQARIVTQNSFPKGTGIASSASGFAALTLAAALALDAPLTQNDLTMLARIGSGSACRSIPDGFVVWEKGTSSATSTARSVGSAEYWDLRDILAVVDPTMKKVPTTEGHETVATSPHWNDRLASVEGRLRAILSAFKDKNFDLFGRILEEDCLDMHKVMQSQVPPLVYWTEETRALMRSIIGWRASGLPVYFTIDAGPNVHVICEGKNEKTVVNRLDGLACVQFVLVNRPSQGAHGIDTHLF